jgi:hypothetical protein
MYGATTVARLYAQFFVGEMQRRAAVGAINVVLFRCVPSWLDEHQGQSWEILYCLGLSFVGEIPEIALQFPNYRPTFGNGSGLCTEGLSGPVQCVF